MKRGDRETEVDGCFTGKEPHTGEGRGGGGRKRVRVHMCIERDKETKLV